jgi:hypothetical protein
MTTMILKVRATFEYQAIIRLFVFMGYAFTLVAVVTGAPVALVLPAVVGIVGAALWTVEIVEATR